MKQTQPPDLLRRQFERLRGIARTAPGDDGAALLDNARFRRKLTDLELDVMALEATEMRADGAPPLGLMISIRTQEIRQRLGELALQAAGPYAAPDLSAASHNEAAVGPDFARGAANSYFASVTSTETKRDNLATQLLDA